MAATIPLQDLITIIDCLNATKPKGHKRIIRALKLSHSGYYVWSTNDVKAMNKLIRDYKKGKGG